MRRETEKLAGYKWRLLVLDEAQSVKNATSGQSVAAKSLNASQTIAMTGTPVENRLSEYWSILETVQPRLLGSLETFLFCGETLPLACARELAHRFPEARILNTYGPTESTVAVTAVKVTDEMLACEEPLPVGSPRPGTRLRIVDAAGSEVPRGAWGEVVIEGDTVAAGYFGRPDLTAVAFGEVVLDGKRVRTYRTGDEGMLDAAGMLHYRGRLDAQVKMSGYRIELGEIEAQRRRIAHVRAAAVVAVERDGRVHHIAAFVVSGAPRPAGDFRAGLTLKEELKQVLPHYMVPRTIRFIDALPQTPNGKVDRRLLAAVAAGRRVLTPADDRA